MKESLSTILSKPRDIPGKINYRYPELLKWVPDKQFLQFWYHWNFGKKLNLEEPVTYNEKLQWLKLYDHNPDYPEMVDKYEAKKRIASILGEEYIVPTLGVWDSFDEIDFDALPDKFVLKTTHDSGGVVICKDKLSFDVSSAKEKINRSLRKEFYYVGREWPYSQVKPRIIAESYLADEDNADNLNDYKFFCFDGYVDNVMMVLERASGNPKYYHFNVNSWKMCRFNRLCRSLPEGFTIEKPCFIDEMVRVAQVLSKGYPHIRIDLYYVNGQIKFGEYTLYNQSGFETGFDTKTDEYLGRLIRLPEKKA